MTYKTRTIWLIPPALRRWLYPTQLSVTTGHEQTCHNEPWDGKPTRLNGRFKFGPLLVLHERNHAAGEPWRYCGWRLWWYTNKPSAGYFDFTIDYRVL